MFIFIRENTKYKCYIIPRSRFSNSSIISLNLVILFFTYTLHILYNGLFQYLLYKTKKTHHFLNNFFNYFIKKHGQIFKYQQLLINFL